jgi:hypothetical protein
MKKSSSLSSNLMARGRSALARSGGRAGGGRSPKLDSRLLYPDAGVGQRWNLGGGTSGRAPPVPRTWYTVTIYATDVAGNGINTTNVTDQYS